MRNKILSLIAWLLRVEPQYRIIAKVINMVKLTGGPKDGATIHIASEKTSYRYREVTDPGDVIMQVYNISPDDCYFFVYQGFESTKQSVKINVD